MLTRLHFDYTPAANIPGADTNETVKNGGSAQTGWTLTQWMTDERADASAT